MSESLRIAAKAALETLRKGQFYEGVCCCGESMENHTSPLFCGHTPVDFGEYYAAMTIENLAAALDEDDEL